jgi:putative copper export protein
VPGVWTAIRFVHVLSAITWVGVQLTLFMLFPVLRRRLEAEQFRTVARTAGMRLGIVAVITLPALLASGIALASHQVPESERGWVTAKLVI